jgi:DNA-binding MarR family transcriptional regulator
MLESNIFNKIKKADILLAKLMFQLNDKNFKKTPSRLQSEIMCIVIDNYEKNILVTQKDIEKKLNISRAAISEALGKMEKYEVIRREAEKTDARIKVIIPTQKSLDIKARVFNNINEVNSKMANILTNDEQYELNKILDKLIDGMQLELNNK